MKYLFKRNRISNIFYTMDKKYVNDEKSCMIYFWRNFSLYPI